MRKIEKRAVICMALAILLAAGMSVFLIKYFAEGGKWASSAFNRHLYDANGVLISGTVLDRDGDVLSSVENGRVGGQMVRKMVEDYQRQHSQTK